ncbi:hypothetical protein [Butyricicoccus intestinisimiae]|jgi:hypothetical protein
MNENYEYPIHLMSFWAINDCLELGKLKKQLLELKEAGLFFIPAIM